MSLETGHHFFNINIRNTDMEYIYDRGSPDLLLVDYYTSVVPLFYFNGLPKRGALEKGFDVPYCRVLVPRRLYF